MHRRGVPRGRHRGPRLFGDLARPEQLERGRDPQPRRRAGRDSPRASRRPQPEQSRYIEAAVCGILDRQPLCAQRQSLAGAEVRLQARLARRAQGPCARPARQRPAGAADRRLQRHPDRPGRLQARALEEGRAVRPAGQARNMPSWSRRAGPTRIRHLHPDERIYTFWPYWRNSFERDAGIRIDHALLSAHAGEEAQGRGSRPHSARLGKDQRPCADVGRGGTMMRKIAVIGAPSSAGAYAPGQEKAPQALRDAGLDRAR